ncbi:unnamed protein product [Eruca vesicaria subsp. sativa]|uniref:Uncharacterized protein n=1 Tax=Eruca vesicaria subsp. sativa TaxID=29727 RepID=A0ABC8LEZ5_ERUVS|nr:unnamed protein product [Eruca vesicaria subsp. sativa]
MILGIVLNPNYDLRLFYSESSPKIQPTDSEFRGKYLRYETAESLEGWSNHFSARYAIDDQTSEKLIASS